MTALALILALVIHECGHIAASLLLGINVKRIVCHSWLRIGVVRETGLPEQNILIALAGPLANLMAAWVWPAMAVENLEVMLFCGLLPVPSSDLWQAGRALLALERRSRSAAASAR